MAFLIYAAASLAAYTLYGLYWRLYLSPIAHFPGPRLAAATQWYEFYWNIWRSGEFMWEIERMHQRYGPIIRINPWELHVNDPDWYDELYAGSAKKRDKYPWFTAGSGSPYSSFETNGHDLHRLRRGAINPFFSKRSIIAIEPLISAQVQNLLSLLRRHAGAGDVLDLRVVYSSLTLDVISAYCFGETWGLLRDEKRGQEWKTTLDVIFEGANLGMHVPFLLLLLKLLPDSICGPVIAYHRNTRKYVSSILANPDADKGAHNTIFHELRDSDLPQSEKTVQRLSDEGNILIGAGGETTAQVLSVLSYHLLSNPDLLTRLRDELRSVKNEDGELHWTQLEQLPFLSAVLNEALRMASPAVTRLPRIAPNDELIFNEWVIPAGVPVSMSYYFIHYNPTIFKEPFKFDPDRWLDTTKSDTRLDKYLVPFTKGSRNCVGLNLAWAELYLATAAVMGEIDMELFETGREDVDVARDCFVSQPKKGSKGIRVKVLGDRK